MKLLVVLVLALAAIAYAGTSVSIQGIIRDQGPTEMCTSGGCGGTCGTSNCNAQGQCTGFVNTDFETRRPYTTSVKGIVGAQCNSGNFPRCGVIGSDRTPTLMLTPEETRGNIYSDWSFYTWFHDTNQTKKLNYSINLAPQGNPVSSYLFDSGPLGGFFPIDGKGWGDSCSGHNFAFCMEAHTRFGYSGDEVFSFSGDDDVWVFMNDYLVIDLGALHSREEATVVLSQIAPTIGMTPGNNYRMDFFYCERHTGESNCKIQTTMEFYCSYNDWCGVCEGNGQSCCTNTIKATTCNDNNACTEDLCPVLAPAPRNSAMCQHKNITCPPATDPCMYSYCDPASGCKTAPIVCNDNNPCTFDSCRNGQCQFITNTCDDSNVCTTDQCSNGVCFNTDNSARCNQTNKCFTYSCDPINGCRSSQLNCNDNNACTDDSCNPNIGCVNTPIVCNDQNPCTADNCIPSSGCSHPSNSSNCPAPNACQLGSCTRENGCQLTAINCASRYTTVDACNQPQCNTGSGCSLKVPNCDDGLACTIDTCVPTNDWSKPCSYTTRNCNDNNPCTFDFCNNGTGCYYQPNTCDDGDACTNDVCTNPGGCSSTPRTCEDFNPCTNNMCKNPGGCYFPPVNCDDNNACTTETCSIAGGGCIYTNVTTDDNNKCTLDTCDPVGGVRHAPITCTGGNACYNVTCDPLLGCVSEAINCDDNNPCTIDRCSNSTGCSNTPKNCDDRDPCTNDSCGSDGTCINAVIPGCNAICKTAGVCLAGAGTCFPQVCSPGDGSCVVDPVICNDNSNCTIDTCDGGECTFTPKDCNDNNMCTVDTCDRIKGCQYTGVVCDDGDPCTIDTCNTTSGCVYTRVSGFCFSCKGQACQYTDACAPKECDATNGCQAKTFSCDDNNDCTNDFCNAGVCSYTSVNCTAPDACQIPSCNITGGCQLTAKNCNDGNPCTVDSCNPSSTSSDPCKHDLTPFCLACGLNTCDTSDPCNPEECVEGQCVARTISCSDSNKCTTDECIASSDRLSYTCNNTLTVFPFSDPCFPQKCDPISGNYTYDYNTNHCDDGNDCTTDACDGSSGAPQCVNAYIECPYTDFCQPQSCVAGSCVASTVSCDDGNACTADSCLSVNGTALCINSLKDCGSCYECDTATGNCDTYTPPDCNDGNACTDDATVCNQDGTSECTNVAWNVTAVCASDACSVAACNASAVGTKTDACYQVPISCVAPSFCQEVAGCDPVLGCQFTAKTCEGTTNDFCLIPACDDIAGCITQKRICPNSGTTDENCYLAVCSSEEGKCSQVERPDFSSRKAKNGVLCPLAYSATAKTIAISAGAAAGIAVAAAAGVAGLSVGGKKAYDYYTAMEDKNAAVSSNPLYESSQNNGDNPLYSPEGTTN